MLVLEARVREIPPSCLRGCRPSVSSIAETQRQGQGWSDMKIRKPTDEDSRLHNSSRAVQTVLFQGAGLCALLLWVAMQFIPGHGVAGIGRPRMNETGTFVTIADDDVCLFYSLHFAQRKESTMQGMPVSEHVVQARESPSPMEHSTSRASLPTARWQPLRAASRLVPTTPTMTTTQSHTMHRFTVSRVTSICGYPCRA